jgi:hypothetical protein
MTRSAVRASDVTRLIRSAEKAGWQRGSYKVVVEGARVTLLPIGGIADEAEDIAQRIESMEAREIN